MSNPQTFCEPAAELSTTERAIAQLWVEVLQCHGQPSAADDFFGLGGDSMAMVMAEFRITEELGVQLPPGATLGASTLRELAALVDDALSGSTASELRGAGTE